MANEHPISVRLLRQLLRLDPESGLLYWEARRPDMFTEGQFLSQAVCDGWNRRWAGKLALNANSHGYRAGSVLGVDYLAHRVIFAIANGHWPAGDTDHINGDQADNRPANLRQATRSENLKNMSAHSRSRSRYKGVWYDKVNKRWAAEGTNKDGRRVRLGRFDCEEEAARVCDDFARANHGDFARLNLPDAN